MKKVYEKPQVYMERFELAEHIAGCSLTMNQANEFVCIGKDFNGTGTNVFASTDICNETNGAIIAEGYCYTNSSINVANINS